MSERAPVAVVGIGCRFPGGADDGASFWRLLRDGRDTVTPIPRARWNIERFYDPNPSVKGKVSTRYGAFLNQVDGFDWQAFRISPREAKHIDPQHRLALEVAWEALEDAGLPQERCAGRRIPVFVGIQWNDYARLAARDVENIDPYTAIGADLSLAANRISYHFDLRGESVALDVACASSLIAIHLACRSIRSGDAEIALAGGTNLMIALDSYIAGSQANLFAPDGRCKTLDASGDGYGRGEGAGIVVLKSLDRAIADRDRIYAVVLGSRSQHNGRTEWIMASRPESQIDLMREALEDARVEASKVQYVELHGTGTRKGDPIEAKAVGAVYGEGRDAAERLPVGSVKTNIGHTEASAGVAGFIKAVLAIHHGEIPPSLHFKDPNPAVPFDELRIRVQTSLAEWPAGPDGTRIAAVNSLALGGASAHVIVASPPPHANAEIAPGGAAATAAPPVWVLPLSARCEPALRAFAGAFGRVVASEENSLTDVTYTASVRRTHHTHRAMIVGRTREELLRGLTALADGEESAVVPKGTVARAAIKPVFVFSGQGAQWAGMSGELIRDEPVFREAITRADEIIKAQTGWSLHAELAAEGAAWRLARTELAQPALVAVQLALTELWRSWGIEPAAVVGHSIGEVTAVCVAGILTVEEALKLACERGRIMEEATGKGAMMQAALGLDEMLARLKRADRKISVAAVNAPKLTVLAGDRPDIEALVGELTSEGIEARPLRVDYAFHSPPMAALGPRLREACASLHRGASKLPIYSTRTGRRATDADYSPDYWAAQMRDQVLFAPAITAMLADGYDTFVEVSPHPVLAGALQDTVREGTKNALVVPSTRRAASESQTMRTSLAALWTRGAPVRFERLTPQGRVVGLPAYPWQRRRTWIDAKDIDELPTHRGPARSEDPSAHPLLTTHVPLAGSNGHVWESTIDVESLPYLRDQTVDGRPIVPGATYLAMVIDAVARAFGWEACRLNDVELKRPLYLGNESRRIQLVLTETQNRTCRFDVFSRPASSEANARWLLHAHGRVSRLAHGGADSTPPAETDSPRSESIDKKACYDELAQRGENAGEAVRWIAQARRGAGVSSCELVAPESLRDDLDRYGFHPSYLNAVLHALPLAAAAPNRRGFTPARIAELRVHGRPQGPTWARARTASSTPADAEVGDVDVVDASGQAVLEVRELVLREGAAAIAPSAEDARWLYTSEWLARSERPSPAEIEPRDGWVLLADGNGVAASLDRQLRERGARTVHAITSAEAQSRDELARALASAAATVPTGGRLRIVHLWSLDIADGAELEGGAAAMRLGCGSVLELVQEMGQYVGATLSVVTRGAHAAGRASSLVAPLQSAVWGLGDALGQEIGSAWGGLIDLDPEAAPGAASRTLLDELIHHREDVALRGVDAFVRRLVPRTELPPAELVSWRQDAAYLVTGGLGGLGHLVAKWMIGQGVHQLVLVGRTDLPAREGWAAAEGRSAEVVKRVRELEALGATVHYIACDIGDQESFAAALQRARKGGLPAIRGVVHCAGVSSIRAAVDLQLDELHATLRPKVLGACVLHKVLAGEPLDFFVLFSSASSVLSSPLMGHYAAGNAFLDALAHFRANQGAPALSINWGPWAEHGMIMDSGDRGPAGVRGMSLIEPGRGLDLFHVLLHQALPQVAVLPVDWDAWLQAHPSDAQSPRFELVRGDATVLAASTEGNDEERPLLKLLERTPSSDRFEVLQKYVAKEVVKVSGLDVGVGQHFFDSGMDSLMALNLANRISDALGIRMKATVIFEKSSVESLSRHVLTLLPVQSGEGPPPEALEPEARAAPVTRPMLPKAPRTGDRPLTLMEESVVMSMASTLHNAGNVDHNTSTVVRLEGAIDIAKFNEAFHRVMRRHDILRTSYEITDGVARCVVHDDPRWSVEVIDLTANPDREAEVKRRVAEFGAREIDILNELPSRAVLYRLGPESWVLAWVVHHLATDGVSGDIMLREQIESYDALMAGRPPSLPEVPRQLSDYAHWQRSPAAAELFERQLAFWKETLKDVPALVTFPTDRPRGGDPTCEDLHFELDAPFLAEMTALAHRHGTLPFTVTFAAFNVVLHRHTGFTDLPIGIPIANRQLPGTERIVGYLANLVCARSNLAGNPTFAEVLERAHKTLYDALANGDLPFMELVGRYWDFSAHPPGAPPFVCTFINRIDISVELPPSHGLKVSGGTVPRAPGGVDVAVNFTPAGKKWLGTLQYAIALYDASTAKRILADFLAILHAVVADPSVRVGEIQLPGGSTVKS